MTTETNRVSVCICTYKRPHMLQHLLAEVCAQETGGLFTHSIVVADNDHLKSAEPVVSEFAVTSRVPVTYCVQPRQNIALTRNKAIENADGNFIVFIDDDEFPEKRWLVTLFKACEEYRVDGAVGPVVCHFPTKPPDWVIRGRFYQRSTYSTGLIVDWRKGRTNNLLIKREILTNVEQPFRPEFRTGEDQDFFRRMIERGHKFVWCNEAVVYEDVPPVRWKRTFMIKRALLQGATSSLHPTFGIRDMARSAVAFLTYALLLPFTLVLGHHKFMKVLIKLFDHLGALLAALGINPIKAAYVTD